MTDDKPPETKVAAASPPPPPPPTPAGDPRAGQSLITEIGAAADSLSKVVAFLVGLAAFVYLIGGGVMFVRLHAAHLPAEEIIPQLPHERLFALGFVELVWTIAAAGVLGALAFVVRARRKQIQDPASGVSWRKTQLSILWVFLTALLGCQLLLAPVSVAGMVFAAIWIGVLLYLGLRRSPPFVEVLLIVVVAAAALTITREIDFASGFPSAKVIIDLKKTRGTTARAVQVKGLYLGATSQDIYIGVPSDQSTDVAGQSISSSLLIYPRTAVEQTNVSGSPHQTVPAESVVARVVPGAPLTCLLPSCHVSSQTLAGPPP